MKRPIRAFVKALQMTIRGETIPPSPYQALEAWIDSGLQLLGNVFVTANVNNFDEDKRAQVKLKLDGHMTSLEQSLQMVGHNWLKVYPKLIKLDDPYTMIVIQSSNMNDQYRVSQFAIAEDITSAELKHALEKLSEHLMNLPTVQRADTA